MRIENLKATVTRRPHLALAVAAIFHVMLTLGVFAVGRAGVVPQQFDRDGIGDFASDGHIHKPVMDSLVNSLKQGDLGSWINSNAAFHVKIFSLAGVVMEPLLGSNILTIEPLNLFYYLATLVLTFTLAKIIAGLRAAWIATLIVAVWPSLLLHSTQFLRDPLIIVASLTLIVLQVLILKQDLSWRRATAGIGAGAAAIFLAWQSRPDLWMVITAIIFVSALFYLAKIVVTRKIVAANLLAMVSLIVLSIGMPRAHGSIVSTPMFSAGASPAAKTPGAAPRSIWRRIAIARDGFNLYAQTGGSIVDGTVSFNSPGDIIRYVPRALEIGYFAPFPSLWFKAGVKVGIIGRILSGVEMVLTYLFEALACIFVWQTRRRYSSWLLVSATFIGMLALGLVVTNVGTLYRMRYQFWVLIVIMAAPVLAAKYSAWFANERDPIVPALIPSEISPAK